MKKKITLFLLILSLIMFLFVLYINSKIVLKKEEIIATLMVGDKAGFDTNNTALTFGIITSGSSSNRNLIIKNDYNFPIKLEFSVEGDIQRFLVFEEVVYLDVGEEKTISISTITATNESYGNYSGKMIIVTKKDIF